MEDHSPAAPFEVFVDPVAGIDSVQPEPPSRATVPNHLQVPGSLLMGEASERSTIPSAGRQARPYKTLSFALQQAGAGTIIYLQPGRYDLEQGEQFPLWIPPGVVVVGDVPGRGQTVTIVGSGEWESPIFGRQNIALLLGDRAQVRGVTVTNPHPQGTGIWVEASTGTIAHCTVRDCGREGIFVTGTATPIVLNCWLLHNRASGMTLTRYGKGEIQRSLFSQNRFGLTLSDFAAPLIAHSEISANQVGMVLSGSSRPVLRDDQIVANQGEGLVIFSQAMPDLGDRQSPAGNRFQFNGDAAVRNVGSIAAIAAGNWLQPQAVRGTIEFRALQPIQRESGQRESGQRESGQRENEPGNGQSERSQASESTVNPFPANPPNVPQELDSAAPPDLRNHWAMPFVAEILSRKIMGCFRDGTFQPDRPITRAQFAALTGRAFKSIELDSAHLPSAHFPAAHFPSAHSPTAHSPTAYFPAAHPLSEKLTEPPIGNLPVGNFRDVPADYWAAEAIAQAVQQGFFAAETEPAFYPEQTVSRWEAIVGLVNGLKLRGLNLIGLNSQEDSSDSLRIFCDRVQIPSLAAAALSAAVAHRLLVLPPMNSSAKAPITYHLSPLLPVSRAEIAAWVYQALVLLNQVKPAG